MSIYLFIVIYKRLPPHRAAYLRRASILFSLPLFLTDTPPVVFQLW